MIIGEIYIKKAHFSKDKMQPHSIEYMFMLQPAIRLPCGWPSDTTAATGHFCWFSAKKSLQKSIF
jgi:hypothetical protein